LLLQPAKDETDEERMVRLEMEALAAEEKARNQAVSNNSNFCLAGWLACSGCVSNWLAYCSLAVARQHSAQLLMAPEVSSPSAVQ
jgi:hypothetical protein